MRFASSARWASRRSSSETTRRPRSTSAASTPRRRLPGIRTTDLRLPASIGEADLVATVAELNADDAVDALLVQLPLPGHIDEERVVRAVDPVKDVDGFHPENAGELYLGRPRLVPATAVGVMLLLAEYGIELEGARAVVVGRSAIVGKPMAQLLLQANATVTICHSRTRDLADQTLEADVLVVAVGKAGGRQRRDDQAAVRRSSTSA